MKSIRSSFVTIAASLGILLGTANAVAEVANESLAHIQQQLRLTSEQAGKVSAILAAQEASCKKHTDEDKKRTCMLFARQQADANIEKLLTEEQKSAFSLLRQERLQRAQLQRSQSSK